MQPEGKKSEWRYLKTGGGGDGQWSIVLEEDEGEKSGPQSNGLALEVRKDLGEKGMIRHECCYI